MKPNAVSLDGIKLNKQARQGGLEATGDGVFSYGKVVDEAQRSIAKLSEFYFA